MVPGAPKRRSAEVLLGAPRNDPIPLICHEFGLIPWLLDENEAAVQVEAIALGLALSALPGCWRASQLTVSFSKSPLTNTNAIHWPFPTPLGLPCPASGWTGKVANHIIERRSLQDEVHGLAQDSSTRDQRLWFLEAAIMYIVWRFRINSLVALWCNGI